MGLTKEKNKSTYYMYNDCYIVGNACFYKLPGGGLQPVSTGPLEAKNGEAFAVHTVKPDGSVDGFVYLPEARDFAPVCTFPDFESALEDAVRKMPFHVFAIEGADLEAKAESKLDGHVRFDARGLKWLKSQPFFREFDEELASFFAETDIPDLTRGFEKAAKPKNQNRPKM